MPRAGKSSVPAANVVVNPYYGKTLGLVKETPKLRGLAVDVRKVAQEYMRPGVGHHDVDVAALLKDPRLAAIKAQFIARVKNCIEAPPPPPVLAPPPRTTEVYGRFGRGTKVLDLGSGNCQKLIKFSGTIDLVASDPITRPNVERVRFLGLACRDALLDVLARGRFLSSWMSMPQMSRDDHLQISEVDGIHLIPNHDYLLSIGAAKRQGDNIVVQTGNASMPSYVDTPLCGVGGYQVEPGYTLATFFAARVVTVTLNRLAPPEESSAALVDCHPVPLEELDWRDIGYKWDGIAYELELAEGTAYVSDRAGRTCIGTYEVVGPPLRHLCLQYENLEADAGGTSVGVLIRIMSVNGMAPGHCGDTLRLFADNVMISILFTGEAAPPDSPFVGGVTTLTVGPPIYEPGMRPVFTPAGHQARSGKTDGIISRSGGRDFYCKTRWTIDINRETIERVEEALMGVGLRAQWSEFPPSDLLLEFEMLRDDGLARFEYKRVRRDKRKETTIETILYLATLTTLEEDVALEGRPLGELMPHT